MRNRQVGPEAATAVLYDLVKRVTYKKDWRIWLEEVSRGQGCEGLTLMIAATVQNSFADSMVDVLHLMPVPAAAYDEDTWKRWILDQILLVEQHECLEFFRVDGDQPFMPEHGPGRNPYTITQIKSRDQAHAPAAPWYGGPPKDEHFS